MGEPMQASGSGTSPGKGDEAIWNAGGESDGDAHGERGETKPTGGTQGYMGHGGQSEVAYHGPSDADADQDNHNAGAEGV